MISENGIVGAILKPKMDISKHIVDQRIRKIVADNPDKFADEKDEKQKLSKAFVCLSVASYLGVELEEAFGCITEGGNDAGVDAIYIGDVAGYDFPVTLFQGKYAFDLSKDVNFPANAIQRVAGSISAIFDPSKLLEMNEDLTPKVEDIRSLIADGYIPSIKCVFASNGLKWSKEGDTHIANAGFPDSQVSFEHYNHEGIVSSLQAKKGISEALQLTGRSIQEGFNFKRVLLGKINVVELAGLFDRHGYSLLDRNIRSYLGLNKSRINSAIKTTLLGDRRDNFYFYNNGITMVCSKFFTNELQESNWKVRVEDLQIINGGQTCRVVQHTVNENPHVDYSNAYVLVRLYELAGDADSALATEITIATNSQNPVDLRDLRSTDGLQLRLETAIAELGYAYKRKKDSAFSAPEKTIPSAVAAEAIYAVWKRKPFQAKFKKNELFGAFYGDVFGEINAAQLLMAVFIYRFCDAQRKKTILINKFPHIPYSSYFMAMIMGGLLLKDLQLAPAELTHRVFDRAKAYFEDKREALFERANAELIHALSQLYPAPGSYDKIAKRRLSATFRRGDLMEYLP